MDVTALRGIAKARWWVLVAAAVLAVLVTGRLADYQADNVITHEAITSITYVEDPANLERGDFEQYLSEQQILAEDANSDLLGETPGPFLPWQLAEIHLVNDQNQIIFIGRGYSQEEANEIATALRDKYLSVSTIGAGVERIRRDLAEITAQITALNESINARQAVAPPTEDETILETQRAAIQTKITSLQGRLGALAVELMNPVERSEAAIQAETERVLNEMITLQLQLRELPQPVDPAAAATPTDEQFLLDQLTLTQLQATWTQLYQQLRSQEALASQGEVVAQPPTIDVTSARYNQMLALVGAVVVAMLTLVAIERTRGIVWSTSEFKDGTPVLTELPPRQLQPFKRPSDEPWYVSVPAGRRKASVQLIRSQLDVLQNEVVAFQGSGVFDADTLDLAADVAMSAAISGRNILLIDATFSHHNTQVEYGDPDDATLMSFFHDLADDPQMAMSEIKETLLTRPASQRQLRALRSGVGEIDAGDALASHRFEMLLDVARENFDLVIMAGAGFGEPTSHILAQRVDHVVLVGSIGHTIDRQVEAAERDFKARRASLAGIVMIRRRRSRLKRMLTPRFSTGLWHSLDWLRSGGEGRAERQPKEKVVREPKPKKVREPKAKVAREPKEKVVREPKPKKVREPKAKVVEEPEEETVLEPKAKTEKETEPETLPQLESELDAQLAQEPDVSTVTEVPAVADVPPAADVPAPVEVPVAAATEPVVDLTDDVGLTAPEPVEVAAGTTEATRGIMEWIRREPKPTVRTGFQSSLERFGVTNPENLSPDRYDVDRVADGPSEGNGSKNGNNGRGDSGGDG